MLLFCSRFYLPLEKTADILLSSGFFCFIWKKKTKQKKKKNSKKHGCNITKLIVRLCSGKTLNMLSMWFGLLEKTRLKFCILADCQMWTHITVSAVSWQSDCAPSEDSDQPGHPPSLIRVFAVRMRKAWIFCYPLSAQRRLWSDLTDAQADLSLRWAHSHFVGFVMRRLICYIGRVVRPQLVETSIKEWIVWEFY